MECICFITHTFKEEFIKTLLRIDNDPIVQTYKVIVLFDNAFSYDNSIKKLFKHIQFIPIDKRDTTYDSLGHRLFIQYWTQHKESLIYYSKIWIVENDVYYPNSFLDFVNAHKGFEKDLLVAEYGLRSHSWYHTRSLRGFHKVEPIGVIGICCRFSPRLLQHIIENIDKTYSGYFEALLPHVCHQYQFSLHQFLPELCGVITTDSTHPLIPLIENDIRTNSKQYVTNRIYHPIKL